MLRRLMVILVLAALLGTAMPAMPGADAVAAAPETVTEQLQGLPSAGYGLLSAGVAASVSAPVQTPIPFSMVGFEVPEGAALEFRTSADGSAWQAWTTVDLVAEANAVPDADTAEARAAGGDWTRMTEPVWVGEARWLQVRGADPAAVGVHLIDSDGLSQSLGQRLAAAVRAMAQPRSAHAVGGAPPIVTRTQWGADESLRRGDPAIAGDVRFAVVHHTAGGNAYTAAQAPAVVRAIYHYHAVSLGWDDIGYNFLVDRYGRTYEGRAGGIEQAVIGAHAQGFNTGSFGVSVMGEFDGAAPPAAAQAAVAAVIGWKFAVHGIDPRGNIDITSLGSNKHPRGTVVNLPTIIGHRDVGQTACPGLAFYNRLPDLRQRVADALAGHMSRAVSACLPQGDPTASGITRLSAEDAISMSARTAGLYWTASDDAVLASAADFADALAGAAIAAARGAPLLLTDPHKLPSSVASRLAALKVRRVWVLGGSAAVSPKIDSAISDIDGQITVTRLAGADRYETAAAIAHNVGAPSGEVAIALGNHPEAHRAWPDALGASALAATPQRIPTLLTRGDRLPAATSAALARLQPQKIFVLGGTAAVSDSVLSQLRGLGVAVERLSGANRYETSIAVATEARRRFPAAATPLVLASGGGFADALVGGPVAARRGGPLLLVPPCALEQYSAPGAYLKTTRSKYANPVLIGGVGTVSERVRWQLGESLKP